MNARWIVVASRTDARIFTWNAHAAELRLLLELENAEGRLKTAALETDRPGMAFRAQGRHPMATKHPAHERAAERFAAEVAKVLESARNDNRVTSLVLVAEPHFLGLLRAALDHSTAAMVEKTIGSDLASLSIAEAGAHLRAHLQ